MNFGIELGFIVRHSVSVLKAAVSNNNVLIIEVYWKWRSDKNWGNERLFRVLFLLLFVFGFFIFRHIFFYCSKCSCSAKCRAAIKAIARADRLTNETAIVLSTNKIPNRIHFEFAKRNFKNKLKKLIKTEAKPNGEWFYSNELKMNESSAKL